MPAKNVREIQDHQATITKSQKLNESNYFLTINLNKIDTPLLRTRFKSVLKKFFNNLERYIKYIHRDDKLNNVDHVTHIDVEYRVERGPKTSNLHVHALVLIKHRTKIRMDWTRFSNDLKDSLRIAENVYCDYRIIGNGGGMLSLKQYIAKKEEK